MKMFLVNRNLVVQPATVTILIELPRILTQILNNQDSIYDNRN